MLTMKRLFVKLALTVITILGITVAADTIAQPQTASASTTSYSKVYKVAKAQLGKRYSYGSTGPSSFDCSGFTSYVYKKSAKITTPRTAQAQYNKYAHVSYKNIKKGDLVFFGGSVFGISHVGLYVGSGKMIDAQNRGVVKEAVKAPWWHYVGSARVTSLD